MSTCTSTTFEGREIIACSLEVGHEGDHCNCAQPTVWWPQESRGSTGGVSGALTGARGDVHGSLPDDGLWPPSNSAQGAVVRARLARLRWALVDEHTALSRLHRDYGGEAVPHDGPGQCPVTDLDLKVLRQACTVLERLIQNK